VLFPRGPGFPRGASAGGAADGPLATAAPATLPPETAAMPAAGFLLRQQEQYHFLNEGYRTFDDFLARLRSHRRSAIRRERRELAAAGITVRTHSGLGRALGFTAAELDQVFDMYVATSQRYTGGPPFLNRRFFRLCAERLGERLELVLARDRHGQVLGGAWNLRGDRRLYGRYWGRRDVGATTGADPDSSAATKVAADPGPSYDPDNEAGAAPVSFLHFEVCYYHAVERCIQAGLQAFEPGHGGDQKLVRGFTPSYTYSAHYLADPRLRLPIEAFLKYEAPLVEEALRAAARRSNLRAPAQSKSLQSGPATAADSPQVSPRASEPISSVTRKTALKDEV
ncbi:MAG TPA: GNAT family N-acetyltransferase, partial [Pseudomonadota bacterium]|nr:GNAT family N-acetyltransferase [Pseudomonadota bacterium]